MMLAHVGRIVAGIRPHSRRVEHVRNPLGSYHQSVVMNFASEFGVVCGGRLGRFPFAHFFAPTATRSDLVHPQHDSIACPMCGEVRRLRLEVGRDIAASSQISARRPSLDLRTEFAELGEAGCGRDIPDRLPRQHFEPAARSSISKPEPCGPMGRLQARPRCPALPPVAAKRRWRLHPPRGEAIDVAHGRLRQTPPEANGSPIRYRAEFRKVLRSGCAESSQGGVPSRSCPECSW